MATETIESLLAKKDALESVLNGFEKWLIVFGVLVAIGVVGESVYGFRSWWNNRKLHTITQSIDDLRRAELAQLGASVREADAKIAEAQRGAAEATRETEQLRKENLLLQSDVLKLHARTEFRHLTPQQQQTIRNRVSRFHPMEFALITFNTGDDSSAIALDILGALAGPHAAGWKLGHQITTSASTTEAGVLIELAGSATPLAVQAGNELAEALRHEGLFVPPVRRYVPGGAMGFSAGPGSPWQLVISVKRRP